MIDGRVEEVEIVLRTGRGGDLRAKYLRPTLVLGTRLSSYTGAGRDFERFRFRIDTGMDIGATLPESQRPPGLDDDEDAISLRCPVVYADGRQDTLEVWLFEFRQNGEETIEAPVAFSGEHTLLGMAAMRGRKLTIDVREGGQVFLGRQERPPRRGP